jgi:DmsE family decaheme c-type cytochrome
MGFARMILWCGVLGAWAPAAAAKQPAPQNFADPTSGSQFVGVDTCKGCHEDHFKSIEATPHYRTILPNKIRGVEVHACESCHGPGSAHVEGGGDKTKIFTFKGVRPEEITKRCMTCHEANSEQREFVRSTHNQNGITCLSCHSVHNSKLDNQLVQQQTQLCYSCHAQQKADFQKPFHHRVDEGLIQCSDCHNPHGSFLGKQLRSAAARDSVCYTCHADKQGPFVFEHQPIKLDGCSDCHSPHGSPNPRLLKTSNLNVLCFKCHTASTFSGASGTPDFHSQAAQYQACTICHAAVHGSNFDRHFLK